MKVRERMNRRHGVPPRGSTRGGRAQRAEGVGRLLLILLAVLWPGGDACAQTFSMETGRDSTGFLVLKTGRGEDRWRIADPVYRFQTGDVDGDGRTEALVGVVRQTRFHSRGRRLFIFKQVRGHVRPMWLGSKLGGLLQDFRWTGTCVRSVEATANGRYMVAEYGWDDFGLSFLRFVAQDVTLAEACHLLDEKHSNK